MNLSDESVSRLRSVLTTADFSDSRYQLGREIGRGGMGVVYEAIDTVLNRPVAIACGP